MSSISSLNSLLSSALRGSSSMSAGSTINLSSLLQAATGASTQGIDVTSAVGAALYADRAPERQWQAQQSTISSQITALTSLQTSLSSVMDDLNNLNDITGSLAARTVSSSSAQVSGIASPGATVGSHTISVQNLATNGSWYSAALPNATSELGTSLLTITKSDGSQESFATGSGVNSLTDLASAINASSSGVNASIVTDANGARLALVSSSTGAASDFTVTYGATGESSWSSASVSAANTPLSASNFQVSDGTSTATIAVSAGDTLTTVADGINAQGIGVVATIVSDPSGFHLQVAATGSNTVTVSADPTFEMTRASTGENASLSIDGIPIGSSSNTVTGAIPGVTLNLSAQTPSGTPATITIGANSGEVSHALTQFVSDYNAALSAVNSQFTYSVSSGSEGVLSTDSSIRSLQGVLEGIGAYSAGATNSIKSLADLGITVSDDGSLTLNVNTLQSALADPASVQNFFQGAALNGFAQEFTSQLSEFGDPATGSIAGEIKNLNVQYSDLQSQVNGYESGYIASQQTILTAMYSKAEVALQQLPAEMQQIQAQLGNSKNNG